METIRLEVWRTDEQGMQGRFREYEVPDAPRGTVLQALQHIYSAVDSTLAFRYSCRFKSCGLCGVRVSGRSRLACLTPVRDGMQVEALHNLPVIRDLVVDRRPLFGDLQRLGLFPVGHGSASKPQDALSQYNTLASCLECLCCHSECRAIQEGADFVGPFVLVKLAQMHFHPQDRRDRRAQARALGAERCLECQGCTCPYGIDLRRLVIEPLLG
jgi:succinate dehydrogenase/fumarate reductase iron-sulfur protein